MSIIGQELPISGSDLVLPVILLVGFCISVSIGVWIWRTRWREHQKQETAEKERKSRK